MTRHLEVSLPGNKLTRFAIYQLRQLGIRRPNDRLPWGVDRLSETANFGNARWASGASVDGVWRPGSNAAANRGARGKIAHRSGYEKSLLRADMIFGDDAADAVATISLSGRRGGYGSSPICDPVIPSEN